MKKTVLGLFILFLITGLTGCGMNSFVKDNSVQDSLKPDNVKEHKLEGAYVFGTIDTSVSPLISGVVIMIKNSPDLYLPIKSKYSMFLIDVPYESTGIAKIAVRYTKDGSVLDKWILNNYDFTLSKATAQYVTNESVTIMNRIISNKRVAVTNMNVDITTIPQVYYLGRLVIGIKDNSFEENFIVSITNNINRDQELLLQNYTSMSNLDMILMDIKENK